MSAHHGTSGKRGSGSPYESDAEPRYDVQTWRKIAYYAGAALTLLGFVLFFVPFLSVFSFFDGLSSGSGGSGPGSFVAFRDFPLVFVGFFLILAGQGLRAVGRRGLAGSGVVLSPEGEARDAEPWRRSRGAQMQDALEEMPMVRDAVAQGAAGQPQIRVRCTACGYLETEDARFCSGCGASMFPS
ncbi:hypothetical protein [Kytococcus sedentarius]|uniref:hypothetical protein n=1 Tax=Kytococcus sedentarius TaxID=1276 RepID=UPI000660A102|nr:hypothetical protein [Kytococcus sedentarius]